MTGDGTTETPLGSSMKLRSVKLRNGRKLERAEEGQTSSMKLRSVKLRNVAGAFLDSARMDSSMKLRSVKLRNYRRRADYRPDYRPQ